ncbi:MAG: hypothetical protein RIQ81_240 [Pseudomonadota bacterium]
MSFLPKIERILIARGPGSCWQEDISAIRSRWIAPGDRWVTPAQAPGFKFVRQPARVMSIGLDMGNGQIAWGDCVGVSFAGKSGRDRAFTGSASDQLGDAGFTKKLLSVLHDCAGMPMDAVEQNIQAQMPDQPSSVAFGISQALVNAVAAQSGKSACQVFAEILGSAPDWSQRLGQIEFQGSCGSNWHDAVERMIVQGIRYLPQGQFEDLPRELGADGSKLFAYIDWLKSRMATFDAARGPALPAPQPRVITLDFHGAAGTLFSNDPARLAAFILELEGRCKPFALHIESPIVMDSFEEQVPALVSLRRELRLRNSKVKIIADEWANTLGQMEALATAGGVDGIHIKMPDTGSLLDSGRAVQLCHRHKLFALLGGSCTETAVSATLAVHLAAATCPDALLVKPGISFDEGFSLVSLEMSKIKARFGAGISD